MPCGKNGWTFVFNTLATGALAGKGHIWRCFPAKFPAKTLTHRRAAWAGVLVARFSIRIELHRQLGFQSELNCTDNMEPAPQTGFRENIIFAAAAFFEKTHVRP